MDVVTLTNPIGFVLKLCVWLLAIAILALPDSAYFLGNPKMSKVVEHWWS